MKTALVYVFPTVNGIQYVPMAQHFVRTYLAYPPGKAKHEIHVAVNGDMDVGAWITEIFKPLPVHYFQHNNFGKDIGAYVNAADQIDCDLMLCMGTPLHFHRAGWLDRIESVYMEHGPAMYGPWGFHQPMPHLRTTCFWIPPELLLAYPHQIGDRQRYSFEHSPDSITLWTQRQGLEPKMVTWTRVLTMGDWEPIPDSETLFIDQHRVRHNIQ